MSRILMFVLVVAGLAALAAGQSVPTPSPGSTSPADPDARSKFLTMFARGYYPGRSGQIFVVSREGEVITERDPSYGFMHGSPWSYDVHIPMLFAGPAFVRQGTWDAEVVQQDVVPTLAALLGIAPPATATGRVLDEILVSGRGRPGAILMLVLDGMRADYFERYAQAMPALSRLRDQGAWFSNARVNTLPSLTSVGHAILGTGTDPRIHGLAANNLFNFVTRKPQPAFADGGPGELMAPALADLWNLETGGGAVIATVGGALRAAIGLAGHGACWVNGRPVILASYSTRDGGWESTPDCYVLPEYLQDLNARAIWEEHGGTWMGHKVDTPGAIRSSALFGIVEGRALAAVLEHEPVGADAIPDLVLVNLKTPDYVGHHHGPESDEMRAALEEVDRQIARALEILDRKAGEGRYVTVVTADHGMPLEPPPGHRHYNDEIVDRIHERFDPEKRVVMYYGDTANSQIYLDEPRLEALGFDLDAVADFLEEQHYILAAFTEDEVRAASAAR